MNTGGRSEVILVVDDSPDVLSVINDTLEADGFSVLVALEGNQALTIVNRIRPDMILMDAMMPHLDGFQTCRELKKNPELSMIPVIFMTGLSATEDVVKGLQAGGVDYLSKPINPEELLARMEVHLSNARLTSSAYRALDSTGQFLFTINDCGRVLWATPQTYALFATSKLSESFRNTTMASELKSWLVRDPLPGQEMAIGQGKLGLTVSLVQIISTDETLLKLAHSKATSEHERLKETLHLTRREAEVLLWLSKGKANREIAEILGMMPRTVNKHLEQIFPKLGVENRTAAASIAIRLLDL